MWCREYPRKPLTFAHDSRSRVSLFSRALYTLCVPNCFSLHPHRRPGDVKVVSPRERHGRSRLVSGPSPQKQKWGRRGV